MSAGAQIFISILISKHQRMSDDTNIKFKAYLLV